MGQPFLVRAAGVLMWALVSGVVLIAGGAVVEAALSLARGDEYAAWHAGGAGVLVAFAFVSVLVAIKPGRPKETDAAG